MVASINRICSRRRVCDLGVLNGLAVDPLLDTIWLARAAVMNIFESKDLTHELKDDATPVTLADQESHHILTRYLERSTPWPVVSEEDLAGRHKDVATTFWLVDPLDGTREFLARNQDFTINVALIQNGSPTFGIVDAPAYGLTYLGDVGRGAFVSRPGRSWIPIRSRRRTPEGFTMLISRSHSEQEQAWAHAQGLSIHAVIHAGSSLKFCRVAEGMADLYPRLGRTMEWDTAAGHAVLVAAGGRVTLVTGEVLTYRKPAWANPAFLAWGTQP